MKKISIYSILAMIVISLFFGGTCEVKAKPSFRIAVARFEVTSSDPNIENIGGALADMTITELSQIPKITVVERSRLEEAMEEHGLKEAGMIAQKKAKEIGSFLGADVVVTGVLIDIGLDPRFRLDFRIIDVEKGVIIDAGSIKGKEERELTGVMLEKMAKKIEKSLFAYDLSGRIVDEKGEPISGVKINFNGDYSPVTTDEQGKWKKEDLLRRVTLKFKKEGWELIPSQKEVSPKTEEVKFKVKLKKVVEFKDENFEEVIREKIDKPEGAIYLSDVKEIEKLVVNQRGVELLAGIENLVNLRSLKIPNNKISDISSLNKLTDLEELDLSNNDIRDISPLDNLINLQELKFSRNEVRDISPLIKNNGLNQGDIVKMKKNLFDLDDPDIMDNIYTLSDRGVEVKYKPQRDFFEGSIVTEFTNTTSIASVAFSPDGNMIVSGNNGDTVKIWDADTGELLTNFTGHTDNVKSVAFSPDGSKVASASNDNTVKVWDIRTGEVVVKFTEHTDSVRSVIFSPDGSKIASGSNDNTVKVWEADTGELLANFTKHTANVRSVAFSREDDKVASASNDDTVKVWDVETKEEITEFTGHSGYVSTVAFSPDGSKIASGSADGTVKIWEASTGELLTSFTKHTDSVKSVAFSPDGNRIVSGSWDSTVKLWDVYTGNVIVDFTEHTHWVRSVDFSPGGSRIVSSSWDSTVKVWK